MSEPKVIQYLDHSFCMEEEPNLKLVSISGWVTSRTDTTVTIAQELHDDGMYRGFTTIYVPCIVGES